MWRCANCNMLIEETPCPFCGEADYWSVQDYETEEANGGGED